MVLAHERGRSIFRLVHLNWTPKDFELYKVDECCTSLFLLLVSFECPFSSFHRPEHHEGDHGVVLALSSLLEDCFYFFLVPAVLRLYVFLLFLLNFGFHLHQFFNLECLFVFLLDNFVVQLHKLVTDVSQLHDRAVVLKPKEDVNDLVRELLILHKSLDLLGSIGNKFFEVLPKQTLENLVVLVLGDGREVGHLNGKVASFQLVHLVFKFNHCLFGNPVHEYQDQSK